MNPDHKKYVDHSDRNPANNNLSNLRWCTRVENSYNASKTKKSTSSKCKGVYKIKNDNKWIARISKNRKSYYLGMFD